MLEEYLCIDNPFSEQGLTKSNVSTKLPFSLMNKEIISKVSKWNPDTHLHNILKGKTWKHLLSDHYLPRVLPTMQFHEIKTTLRGDRKLTLLGGQLSEHSRAVLPQVYCSVSPPANWASAQHVLTKTVWCIKLKMATSSLEESKAFLTLERGWNQLM